MQRDDGVFAGHMLDSAAKALGLVGGRTRAEFDADETLQLACLQLIQRVGEAARHTSEAFRAQHPEVEWDRIIGMRHRVVHDYFEVNWDIVWDVLAVHLSDLVERLQRFVPPAEP
ncbi:MAG: HepT-like ribonuclease domain-containing protein [Gemmatimonadota bacterium]